MDYRVQDHEKARRESVATIIKGCKGILTHGGFSRGTLGTFMAAMSLHTSLGFIPTIDFLKKQSAELRAEGIELVFHDDEGRDLELIDPGQR